MLLASEPSPCVESLKEIKFKDIKQDDDDQRLEWSGRKIKGHGISGKVSSRYLLTVIVNNNIPYI